MVFSINTLTGANGGPWVNLIEFKNRLADTGLYSQNGASTFFDEATGPSGDFSPDVPVTLLLTRNARHQGSGRLHQRRRAVPLHRPRR